MDPAALSNWTVTHVDWSDGGWHPRAYKTEDKTEETFGKIQVSLEMFEFLSLVLTPQGKSDVYFNLQFFIEAVIILVLRFACLF